MNNHRLYSMSLKDAMSNPEKAHKFYYLNTSSPACPADILQRAHEIYDKVLKNYEVEQKKEKQKKWA